jgi:hypothetical protein
MTSLGMNLAGCTGGLLNAKPNLQQPTDSGGVQERSAQLEECNKEAVVVVVVVVVV